MLLLYLQKKMFRFPPLYATVMVETIVGSLHVLLHSGGFEVHKV
jgi:hypothetical protein